MILGFIAGLVALVAGAELLVRGASKLALSAGISPLVVGLTVVAFGTSAPEVAVAVGAVLEGKNDIAIGNVVGSNIFNVLFILGLSAVITPLFVNRQVIRQEVPIMAGASLLLLVLSLDRNLGLLDCALLILLLAAYTVFLVVQSRQEENGASDEYRNLAQDTSRWDARWPVQMLLMGAGLGLLVLGSRWLVTASVSFAQALGVSDLVIGLTIVAAGTSMPEVATSLLASMRGEREIAIGNAIGSTTFNILGCVGISGLVSAGGLAIAPSVLKFDIWVMLASAFACLPVFLSGRKIARWEGAIFLAYYIAYTSYLILAAQNHRALPAFSNIMLSYILPMTVVTFVVIILKPADRR
ncbi:calcium/sodium antiporter [Noviherbaspirillum aerium]|uniref:calcium/sodium antiporter n=1 Tax=Noviherbaspirillum aerium TaxID=2588497 RepID=UPI001CEF6413|nr:calcium/sodium antiporter [Noviherbaspirillum aerium]